MTYTPTTPIRKCAACGRHTHTVDETDTCGICRKAGIKAQPLIERTRHEAAEGNEVDAGPGHHPTDDGPAAPPPPEAAEGDKEQQSLW